MRLRRWGSSDEAQRNPGTFAPAVRPTPDWHPGYKNGTLVRRTGNTVGLMQWN
jgi:hypothetical protein